MQGHRSESRVMTFRSTCTLGTLAVLGLFSPVRAQEDNSGKPVVEALERICLKNQADVNAIAAELNADSNWKEKPFPDTYRLDKSTISRAWDGIIAGREFEVLVAKASYATKCILRTPDKESGYYPYRESFLDVLGRYNLKIRDTDVPHYMRASGKFEGHRVEVKLMTRSYRGMKVNYTSMQVTY